MISAEKEESSDEGYKIWRGEDRGCSKAGEGWSTDW
jgi:hypothetical protein